MNGQHLFLLFRINTNKMRTFLLSLVASAVLFSCSAPDSSSEQSTENQTIKIVCTTSIMTDWVDQITGDSYEVVSLLNKGIDPHVYKPSKKDLDLLRSADVIIYHGVHLEGKIIEVLEKMQGPLILDASTLFEGDDIITDESFAASQDPHYWFDTELAGKSLTYIADELGKKYPETSEELHVNKTAYMADIAAAKAQVEEIIATIPDANRTVVTTHDALSYFARTFDLRVETLQGASTVSEFGLREITELVNFICDNSVPAIFLENIVSPQAMESVKRGCEEKGCPVELGPELLSDSLGTEEDQDTYTEMLVFNARLLASYLGE